MTKFEAILHSFMLFVGIWLFLAYNTVIYLIVNPLRRLFRLQPFEIDNL